MRMQSNWKCSEMQYEIELNNIQLISNWWDSLPQKANPALEKILPVLIPLVSESTPDWISQMNYDNNLKYDITDHLIFDQSAEEILPLYYGCKSADENACGPISEYNALHLRGEEPSLASIIHDLEQRNGPVVDGIYGTNPYAIASILCQYDVNYQMYSDLEKMEDEIKNGDIAIIMIWNSKDDFQRGAHFFTVQKVDDGYEAYNRYSGDCSARSGADLSEIIGNSQYIYGYILH